MEKQTRSNVYVRKADRATLKILSEKTGYSQAEILSQWLQALEVVMKRFSSLPYDRLSFASYPTAKKEVQTLLAPVLSGSLEFEATNDILKDDVISQKAVHEDIVEKLGKVN